VEVGLHVHALRSEASSDGIPLLLSCREFVHVHCSLDGEMLAEEALGDNIFVVPVFALPLLNVSDVVQVLGVKASMGLDSMTCTKSELVAST